MNEDFSDWNCFVELVGTLMSSLCLRYAFILFDAGLRKFRGFLGEYFLLFD